MSILKYNSVKELIKKDISFYTLLEQDSFLKTLYDQQEKILFSSTTKFAIKNGEVITFLSDEVKGLLNEYEKMINFRIEQLKESIK